MYLKLFIQIDSLLLPVLTKDQDHFLRIFALAFEVALAEVGAYTWSPRHLL